MIYESVTLYLKSNIITSIRLQVDIVNSLQFRCSLTDLHWAFGMHKVILGYPLQSALNHTWVAQMRLFGQ